MTDEICEIIAAQIAGEHLSTTDREKLERWRKETLTHEQEYRRLIEMQVPVRLVQEHGGIIPEVAYHKVEKRIRVGKEKTRQRKIRRYLYFSGAAGMLLLLGVALTWWMQPTQPTEENETSLIPGSGQVMLTLTHGELVLLKRDTNEIIRTDTALQIMNRQNTLVYSGIPTGGKEEAYNTLTVPAAGEYRVILSDGTIVFLNSGSEFRYPEVFQGERREVYLKGEAWFEVTKDTTRAFLVHTDLMDVRVLGTSFNVRAYEKMKSVATTLVSGSVEVTGGEETVRILPGEQFVFYPEEKKTSIRKVDTEMYTSWKDGYYKFRQATLEEIMTTLSVWYGLNVFYQNEDVKQLEFTGRVKRYEDVSNLLHQFEQTENVLFYRQGNNVVIQLK